MRDLFHKHKVLLFIAMDYAWYICICFWVVGLGEICEETTNSHYSYTKDLNVGSGPLKRLILWDSTHYVDIAKNGYCGKLYLAAYYPLLPAIIRIFCVAIGNWSPVYIIILTNLISMCAIVLGYYYVKSEFGCDGGFSWVVWVLLMPGSIYLHLIYTEGLFILLTVGILFSMRKKNILASIVVAFLLPQVKAVGIFVVLFCVLCNRTASIKSSIKIFISGAFGYLVYFFVIYISYMDPFMGFKAQKFYPTSPSVANIFDIGKFLQNLLGDVGDSRYSGTYLDKIIFCLYICVVPALLRQDKIAAAISIIVCALSVLSSGFISYVRHSVTCFAGVAPNIMRSLDMGDNYFLYILISCYIVKTILIHYYFNNMWVS